NTKKASHEEETRLALDDLYNRFEALALMMKSAFLNGAEVKSEAKESEELLTSVLDLLGA
ncbi:MAG: hypothetical protein GTO54_09560, partial [Nitrososphaeria archaeon]|nr:hypothetical protein [Nitrososphaeria archaeon]